MQLTAPLGIFGGTFDPIHNGHIYPVLEAAKITQIKNIGLMPCFIPSHKSDAIVSSKHRLKMVELICEQYPLFFADPRDIKRGKPTFTVDSLQEIRSAMPNTPICFFIGTDSLQKLCTWHQWQRLFSLCHFVVCERKGDAVDKLKTDSDQYLQLQNLLKERQIFNVSGLHSSIAGHIYIAKTATITLSSTEVRNKIYNNQSVEDIMPPKIIEYIEKHKLYQPSTGFC